MSLLSNLHTCLTSWPRENWVDSEASVLWAGSWFQEDLRNTSMTGKALSLHQCVPGTCVLATLVMEGAKGRTGSTTGHLGFVVVVATASSIQPCCSGTLGSSSRVTLRRTSRSPQDTPVPSGLGSHLPSSLISELQPGAQALERVSIATAATHSPFGM